MRDTQRENERLFLEYCTRLVAEESARIAEALEDDGPVHNGQLFQERTAQLEQAVSLVKALTEDDSAEPLELRLERRIQAIQRRIMRLASQVYDRHHYPEEYWTADEEREFLVELLSAWHHWNNPDYTGPILNV